ncbi:MAG TPA: hypothetical protein VJI68_02440 [Candidatus Nanoarchaeia archaeon]|nr:hypothetical protein [Candidatus Nanoarchaeia archaeon]
MDITTIKLHKNTKSALDELRSENETYDNIINKLITKIKDKNLKKELIEAYKNMGKEDLRLLEEWETASNEFE